MGWIQQTLTGLKQRSWWSAATGWVEQWDLVGVPQHERSPNKSVHSNPVWRNFKSQRQRLQWEIQPGINGTIFKQIYQKKDWQMGQCLLGRSLLGTQSLMHMSGWNGQGVNKRSFSDSWTREPEELLWYQKLLETLMSLQVRKCTNGGVRGWR